MRLCGRTCASASNNLLACIVRDTLLEFIHCLIKETPQALGRTEIELVLPERCIFHKRDEARRSVRARRMIAMQTDGQECFKTRRHASTSISKRLQCAAVQKRKLARLAAERPTAHWANAGWNLQSGLIGANLNREFHAG